MGGGVGDDEGVGDVGGADDGVGVGAGFGGGGATGLDEQPGSAAGQGGGGGDEVGGHAFDGEGPVREVAAASAAALSSG